MSSSVLMVVAGCPGYFLEATYRMAERLRDEGHQPVFAVTTPYYERFKGFRLADLGPVHYISDFLRTCPDDERVQNVELDYWLVHGTFVRTRYFHGRHINGWDDYRKVVLFFRDLLDANPDLQVVWSETPSNSVICVAQAEAERRGLPFLGYIGARVPRHFNVIEDRYATRFMDNPTPPASVEDEAPDYMQNPMANLGKRSPFKMFEGLAGKTWSALRARGERSIEMGDPFRVQAVWYQRQVTRTLYYRYVVPRKLFSGLPERNRDRLSVVFPLHYRPEASTSVQAQYYENDVETIRNIAFSLPHRASLYVKEHPSAVGLRSRSFYREILTFPGVHLLDTEPSLSTTLERFDAVVSLTSTAGFEALQRGLPVLLLGRTFYETYPGVTRVQSWDALRLALAALEPGKALEATDAPMSLYLKSCFAGTFNYMSSSVTEPANVELLTAPLRLALQTTRMPSSPSSGKAAGGGRDSR